MEFISLLLLSVLFLYLCIQFFARQKPLNYNNKGFKNYPLLGCLPEFLKNRHRFLEWTTQVLRDCPTNTAVISRPFKIRGVITANPENVEHMLKTNFENYPKGQRFNYLLQDFYGQSIFNSDGQRWMVQRKTASYEFTTKSLQILALDAVTTELQNRLLPIFSKASESNTVLDLQDIMDRFGFDSVCKLAFNVDPACLGGDSTVVSAEFMRSFEDAAVLSLGRFMSVFPFVWKIKKIFNFGSERRLRESITTVHEFADKIMRSRLDSRDRSNEQLDLLSRFIKTEDSTRQFLRDVVVGFILAGRDSTSSALSSFFWILSSKQDVRKKIHDEIERVRSAMRGDGAFGYQELKEMHYLHAAISETMRLYPPVPVDTKACLNDDVLPDGTRIGKGWFITYHTYAMGRMENIWGKDCTEFKPERWLEDGVYRGESPFRYPVFHAGPRMCLGKEMAYIQMKMIAASVMERFEIEALAKDTCPKHTWCLTLRIKGGLAVKVRVRDGDFCM